jgi:hypothetical protein
MKTIIGGLLVLVVLMPVKAFGYADTPQEAVTQPCGTIQQIADFINTFQCSDDQKISKYVRVCVGENVNGITITSDNQVASMIICRQAIATTDAMQQQQNRQYATELEAQERAQVEEQQTRETQTQEQARQDDEQLVIRHRQELKAFLSSIGNGIKSVGAVAYQVLIYIFSIHIPWIVVKLITIILLSLGFILALAYWLGGGR